jgi:hypothetical protein
MLRATRCSCGLQGAPLYRGNNPWTDLDGRQQPKAFCFSALRTPTGQAAVRDPAWFFPAKPRCLHCAWTAGYFCRGMSHSYKRRPLLSLCFVSQHLAVPKTRSLCVGDTHLPPATGRMGMPGGWGRRASFALPARSRHGGDKPCHLTP